MGQHKILLGNFPCLQNHFWPVRHTHPELPAPQGSLPGRCDQPSAQLSLPRALFWADSNISAGLDLLARHSHLAQPELHAPPGKFFLLTSKRPLQRGGEREGLLLGAPTERFGGLGAEEPQVGAEGLPPPPPHTPDTRGAAPQGAGTAMSQQPPPFM